MRSMSFRQLSLTLALVCSTLAPAGCASTTVEHVWRSPEWSGQFDHIVVFGVSKRPGVRRAFELSVAEALREAGVQATPSFELFPEDGELRRDEIASVLTERRFDGILMARLVAIDEQQRYVAGTPYVIGGGLPPYGFFGYYHWAYGIMYAPVYALEYDIVTIESNLYDAATDELVWSGLSRTFDPDDVDEAVRSYAKAMTKTLVKAGLVE